MMKLSIANLAIIFNSTADIFFWFHTIFVFRVLMPSVSDNFLFYLQKTVVNDFVIPDKNARTSEEHRGRHF